MSVIKPINFLKSSTDKPMSKKNNSIKSIAFGFFMGAFVMGCLSYFLFLKYEVAPRVPALITAWTHHEEVQSLQISQEFIVKK
jgi:uncharacterized membrane protein YjjB (DUF3815 family)